MEHVFCRVALRLGFYIEPVFRLITAVRIKMV